jgi:hypothetical protein
MDNEELYDMFLTCPGRGKCREVPNVAYKIKITIPEKIGKKLHNGRQKNRNKRKCYDGI